MTSLLNVSGLTVLLLLQELQSEFGLTYIFISHSLPVVAQVATRIAVMHAGKFVEVGLAEQVLHQPLGAAGCCPGIACRISREWIVREQVVPQTRRGA